MFINVQQRNASFSPEYDIETPGCIYFAQQKFFTLKKRITLTAPRERLLAKIVGTSAFFHVHFDFDFADGRFYEFWTESNWQGVYGCENRKESYRLYRHRGFDYSIFQSDNQIAAFTRNRIKIGAGDQYDVLLNDDADPILVICMVLAIDSIESPDSNRTLTYDFGNVGPEDRPFDKSWAPS